MKLISYPENYSSIFGDNVCRFEQVNPDEPFEVTIEDDVVGVLGAKRFVGSAEVGCALGNYLHRRLDPQPLLINRTACTEATGRNVRLTAHWGSGQKSPKMTFTLSHDNLSLGDVVGGPKQSRSIAAGEVDEVLFVSGRENGLTNILTLSTGECIHVNTKSSLHDGLWAWVVCADDVISRSAHPDELEWFKMELLLKGESIAIIHYTLVPPVQDAVRLAWLDASGQIFYHNFPHAVRREVETSSVVAELAEGTTTLSKSGWELTRLDSGVVSKDVVAHLEGIATSPRVWVIEDGVAIPVVLLSAKTVLSGVGRGVSLTLRPTKMTKYW